MPRSIKPVRLNHMNLVLESAGESIGRFKELYGAYLLADMPQKEMHAYLIDIGRVIFEGFVPHEYLLNARYGPHYVGVEYQADINEVRAALQDHSIRTVRDIGIALHTHPEDCFGVAFEFYDGYFHDREWELFDGRAMKPAEYWRDEHPLGITGMKGYTLAAFDIHAASQFLQSFLSGVPVYEEERDAISGRAVGLQVADAVVEVISPDGPGILLDHMHRYGEGIRSTVFGVGSIDQARDYFAQHGVEIEPGSMPQSIQVPAPDNCGVLFEFVEDI